MEAKFSYQTFFIFFSRHFQFQCRHWFCLFWSNNNEVKASSSDVLWSPVKCFCVPVCLVEYTPCSTASALLSGGSFTSHNYRAPWQEHFLFLRSHWRSCDQLSFSQLLYCFFCLFPKPTEWKGDPARNHLATCPSLEDCEPQSDNSITASASTVDTHWGERDLIRFYWFHHFLNTKTVTRCSYWSDLKELYLKVFI